MKSEVRVSSPSGLKIYVAIGVTMAIVLIAAMLLYPDAVRAILYSVAAVIFFGGASRGLLAFAHGWQSLRRSRLENDLLAAEVATKRNRSGVIHHGNYFLTAGPDGWQGVRVRDIESPQIVDGQAVEVERRRTIYDVIDEAIHVALFGGTNAGKTTLANHILNRLIAAGALGIICDPHAKRNNWTSNARVVSDYGQIGITLDSVYAEMRRRYDSDAPEFQPMVVALDEWPAIVDEVESAGQNLKRLSREGRKVNIRLVLLSQSDLVDDLGANSSIKDNFIKIAMTAEQARRNEATIRHWDKTIEVITLAGPYYGSGGGRFFNRSLPELALPEPEQPDEFERDYLDGMSRNKLAEKYYPGMARAKQLELVRDRILRLDSARTSSEPVPEPPGEPG